MDKKIFENLQNHVFDKDNPWPIWADGSKKPNRLSYFSSWAIYGKNDLDNKEVIEDNVIHSLNGGIVFVGLNFSKPLWSSWGPWQNIHGNYNVRWLLDGENGSFNAEKVQKYKGAYITDIIKNHIGSMAAKVMNQLDQEKINKNIGWFFEEIDMLGADAIEMYLFGKDVEYLFRNYVMRHKDFSMFRQKVKKCQRIEHYAGSNNGRFRNFAPQQLGLVALSEQDVLHILWNDLEEKTMPGADERQDRPRPGPANEADNARKPPAGSGNISDTQDLLHKIEEFLRGKIETGAMHFSPARRPDYLSIRVKRGVGFLVHDSPNKGIFLEWWLKGAGEHWYEEKRTRLSTYHIDSHIHFTQAAISEPRLHIPVHKRPYGEAVLDIIKIIKDIMGY